MINFIIVEDNELHMKKIKSIVNKMMMKNNYCYEMYHFFDFDESFKKCSNSLIGEKIYILDYQLKNNYTAIDVARHIRSFDLNSQIIVFTVNDNKALETFKERLLIYDFIDKKIDAEKHLTNSLISCINLLSLKDNLNFSVSNVNYSIPYNQILYVYKDTFERKSVIVTNSMTLSIPKTLNYMKKMLNFDFIYTHRSCIVNKKRVFAFKWPEKIILFDNSITSNLLSKKYRKEIENEISSK